MTIRKVGPKVRLARLPLLSVRISPSENRTCNLSVAIHESYHWTRQPWSIQELSRLYSTRCIDIILNYVPKLLDPGPLPLKRRSLHFVRHYKLQRAYIYDHLCNQSNTHLFNFNGFGPNSNGRIAGDRNGRTHNSSWDCLLNIGSKVDGILKIF